MRCQDPEGKPTAPADAWRPRGPRRVELVQSGVPRAARRSWGADATVQTGTLNVQVKTSLTIKPGTWLTVGLFWLVEDLVWDG